MPSIRAIFLALAAMLATPLALGGPASEPRQPMSSKAADSAATTKKADEAPPREVSEIDTNTCVTCHGSLPEPKYSTPAKQFVASVHADDRIGCVGCHKGDPEIQRSELTIVKAALRQGPASRALSLSAAVAIRMRRSFDDSMRACARIKAICSR